MDCNGSRRHGFDFPFNRSSYGQQSGGGFADENLQKNARWYLAVKTDTHGNAVSYNYSCPDLPVCVVASIHYNGAGIAFAYDQRPDFVSYASGLTISTLKYRLKAISDYSNSGRGWFTPLTS